MPIAKSSMAEKVQASVSKSAQGEEMTGLGGVFTMTCLDKDGNVKWEEQFHNLVVNEGLQYLNFAFFRSLATTYTAAWYLGLVNNAGLPSPPYVAGDTLASHGWAEVAGGGTVYTGNRKQVTFGTATTANPSVIDNSASPSTFSITASATIAGAFLCNQETSNVGVLFSAGSFSSAKTVASGDTVNVTYTFSAAAT